MKILLSAYACEPGKGSEPEVGWNWVKQIAHFATEVWVITRTNNRPAIEMSLAKNPMPNVHWVYFDLPYWARFWKKGRRGVHLYYYLWQIGIYFLARRLHQEISFDLVHHVTFVNYWMPSFLAMLPVRFIWGPVGGGESTPRSFYSTFSHRGRLYEYTRVLARSLGEYDPFTRMTARRATVALATTRETAKRITQLSEECRVLVMSQVALPKEEIRQLSNTPFRLGDPFRLLSLGNLLHLKGFHLGLVAFANLIKYYPQSQYWIVGNGPERKNLEQLAERLDIADKVFFWGALPRMEAIKKLAECDVLVHPSLHDSGGFVVVEAMATGRPVICLDLGGPAVLMTEETGFKIPAKTPEQVINEIMEAMLNLATDKQLYRQIGEAARRHIRKALTWEQRGERIRKIYTEALAK